MEKDYWIAFINNQYSLFEDQYEIANCDTIEEVRYLLEKAGEVDENRISQIVKSISFLNKRSLQG